MTFEVQPYAVPIIEHPASRKPLYPHQIAMWDEWQKRDTILLAARTGTGKTKAAVLPILRRGEWAVAVYPTNELLRDQVRSVERFAKEEGIEVAVHTPESETTAEKEKYSRTDHLLVPIDGAILSEWQRKTRCKSRGEALRRLLNPDKPRIIFTNPDILFLILGLHYHAEPLAVLQKYQTLLLDEFHLYQGVELAHILVIAALARGFNIFRRLVLLSATPHPEVRDIVDRALKPFVVETGSALSTAATASRVAVHKVQVTPIMQSGGDPVEDVVAAISPLRKELQRLQAVNRTGGYVPGVVIVNSVVNAIRLEDRLAERGFCRESIAVIRGLSNRAIRDTRGKLLALGTSAIEVGVDFECDYLWFEAIEAASFLQRFGRVGRHRPGKAVAFVPPNVFQGMKSLPREIERGAFEERINAWYPSANARAWFVTTEYGVTTGRALAENLMSTVATDPRTSPDTLSQLRVRVELVLADHVEKLGCPKEGLRARTVFERFRAGKAGARWVETYCKVQRFRTSLPSVKVHDFSEQRRRGDKWEMGEYEADLRSLLMRAKGVEWNKKLAMLTIKGIGKYRRVHASEIFSDSDCCQILETTNYPELRLYQDGESTPLSEIMGQTNHIFAVLPKSLVASHVDWRMAVFEAGDYVLAFDGAALLLLEIARRGSRASSR